MSRPSVIPGIKVRLEEYLDKKDALRPKIHHHVGGASQVLENKIYTATDHLQTPTWEAVFNPQ